MARPAAVFPDTLCVAFGRGPAHINIQEARAYASEVRAVATELVGGGRRGCRQIFLVDSRVLVGAVRRGRSSSLSLNGVLRGALPFLLMGRLRPCIIWIPSKANPADHPSRGVEIPPPLDGPPWLSRVLDGVGSPESAEQGLRTAEGSGAGDPDRRLPTGDVIRAGGEEPLVPRRAVPVGPMMRTASGEETVCREFFGGGGLLTEAWRRHGLPVMPPVETFPSGQAFRGDHDLRTPWVLKRELWRARSGWYRGVHLMPPMGTFGSLARLGKSSRTETTPEGGGGIAREEEANLLLRGTCEIATAVALAGGRVTVELPFGSLAEKTKWWREMMRKTRLERCDVDLCCHGAGPPDQPALRY
jgi:hypothetical protein